MLAKQIGRVKRHERIRKKIFGTAERPRLSVRRSLKNLYAQVIDDVASKTLFSFSTADKAFQKEVKSSKGKISKAEKLGEFYGPRLKEKGIKKIAFDRGGYLYHGRVKALADSLRKTGIQF
jgi:large subunit ribosomal protein L18